MSRGLTGRMPNERYRPRPEDGSEWWFKGTNGSTCHVLSTTLANVYYMQDGVEGMCSLDEWLKDMEPKNV